MHSRHRVSGGLATSTGPTRIEAATPGADDLVATISAVARQLTDLVLSVPPELREEVRERLDAEFARAAAGSTD